MTDGPEGQPGVSACLGRALYDAGRTTMPSGPARTPRCAPLLVLAACLAILPEAALADTITVALNADIRSSEPGVNRDDNTDGVVLNVVEGLVAYREDGSVGPLLAEAVDLSADGLTYTFRLRRDVQFHNGEAMTAADVLWSWARYTAPKTGWRCLADVDGRAGLKVTAVAAPDPHTVTMRIDHPSALFLDTLARTDCGMAGVLHHSSLKSDSTWDRPIGTGPFSFGTWARGQSVTLTKFDGYASPPGDKPDGYTGRKQPLADEVRMVVVPDAATAKAGLLSGALDVAQVLPTDISEFRAGKVVSTQAAPSSVKVTLLIETSDPVMSSLKLRQAIAAAIDYQQIVAAASNDLGAPNNSAIPPQSAFSDVVQRTGYTYDPAKTQALLKVSGYKGETIHILANKRVHVPSYEVAVVAQAMMEAVGIKAQIDVIEWATQLDRYNSGKYQMMSFSYSSRLDPALSYEQFMGPKATQPRKVWDDPSAQALLDRASTVSDRAERQTLFDELHKRQLEAVPLLILYNGIETWGASARVTGFSSWEGKPRLWGVRLAR